jgi:Zn-dependent oligopeptidase
VAAIKKVTDIVSEIAAASREQSAGIEQVNKAVMQLDELTQQNAALVEEATASSETMAEQARALNNSMQRFRVNGSDAAQERAAALQAEAMGHGARSAPAAAARGSEAAQAIERRKAGRPWSAPRTVESAPKVAPSSASNADDAMWKEF